MPNFARQYLSVDSINRRKTRNTKGFFVNVFPLPLPLVPFLIPPLHLHLPSFAPILLSLHSPLPPPPLTALSMPLQMWSTSGTSLDLTSDLTAWPTSSRHRGILYHSLNDSVTTTSISGRFLRPELVLWCWIIGAQSRSSCMTMWLYLLHFCLWFLILLFAYAFLFF